MTRNFLSIHISLDLHEALLIRALVLTSYIPTYQVSSIVTLWLYSLNVQVEVEGGGFQCRVILPDDKKSEADVILWYRKEPTRTSMEAQHRASVMALHHVMGNRR